MSIEPNLTGMSYSFPGNRLTNLWSTILDTQGASATELATRFGAPGSVLRDGQAINYALRYRNTGSQTVRGLVAVLSASHALQLSGSSQLTLGDLAPGEEQTVTFGGVVNLAAAQSCSYQPCLAANPNTPGICLPFLRLARLRAEIRDETYAATNTALDWAWADHAVDGEAPQFFGIDLPNYTITTGAVATSGYAYDPSGVSSIRLEIQTPNNGTQNVVCPDTAPRDGVWSCAWNASQLNGGQAPANGATFKMVIDNVAPQMTVRQVTSTSPVSVTTRVLEGTMGDGGGISKMLVMVRTPGGNSYTEEASINGNSWSYGLTAKRAGDYVLVAAVVDEAGNVSSSQEYIVKAGSSGARILLSLVVR